MRVVCHLCGVEFDKPDKEVRRQQKEGRDYFFCSRSWHVKTRGRWLCLEERFIEKN
ncbi:hypothetical protein [Sporomusa sp.]|uniref:hypothetical protein n=1 Tax=Sporomusa sp. TaxID=2078658 RepID=UPI002CCC74DA|nr:hypothetical protein [Sporomusa sp.]HWR06899.1 hypothetical protein [Sporomusa sp.]